MIGSTLLVLIASGVAYAFLGGQTPFSSKDEPTTQQEINLDTPTDEQIDDGNDTKEETLNPDKTPTNNDNVPVESSTLLTITAKNQLKDTSQNMLQIRAQIDSVDSTGTCTLTLSDGTNSITRTAGVQPQATVSTCQGFNVDINTAGLKTGTWSIKLSYTAGDISGSASDTVTVK